MKKTKNLQLVLELNAKVSMPTYAHNDNASMMKFSQLTEVLGKMTF